MSRTTYLDHAATTPLRPEVAAAMASVHEMPLGNPTGSHPPAQRARALLEEAREQVASFLGRDAGEIVFTSGGTEAANLAVLGSTEAAWRERGEGLVLASAVEHPAVLESAKAAAHTGIEVRELPVDANGVIHRDALELALSSRCTLVAVMAANNETGVVEPLADVVDAVRRRAPQAYVFTDAVQATSYLDLTELEGVDMVGLSAHKFGGPVGIGALAVSPRVNLSARRARRRSGTRAPERDPGRGRSGGHGDRAAAGRKGAHRRLVTGLRPPGSPGGRAARRPSVGPAHRGA